MIKPVCQKCGCIIIGETHEGQICTNCNEASCIDKLIGTHCVYCGKPKTEDLGGMCFMSGYVCGQCLMDSTPRPMEKREPKADPVNNPSHYNIPGVQECIEIIIGLGLSYQAGNAMKYLYRHLFKGKPIEDLKKAVFYINKEIERLEYEERKRADFKKDLDTSIKAVQK